MKMTTAILVPIAALILLLIPLEFAVLLVVLVIVEDVEMDVGDVNALVVVVAVVVLMVGGFVVLVVYADYCGGYSY